MSMDRVCGTCIFGADAMDRNGNIDPNYVICQVKEAESRNTKPDRFRTISGVTRMHYHREACLHWRGDLAKLEGEYELPQAVAYTPPVPIIEVPIEPVLTPKPVLSAAQDNEINNLKLKLIQQDQMVLSLQNQNVYLSEQVTELQGKLQTAQEKIDKLSPFDPAIFVELNYFALLGISEQAGPAEIKDAYRQRMKHLHPDRFINISQRVNQAYETLMDADKRSKYLRQLKGQQHG